MDEKELADCQAAKLDPEKPVMRLCLTLRLWKFLFRSHNPLQLFLPICNRRYVRGGFFGKSLLNPQTSLPRYRIQGERMQPLGLVARVWVPCSLDTRSLSQRGRSGTSHAKSGLPNFPSAERCSSWTKVRQRQYKCCEFCFHCDEWDGISKPKKKTKINK